VEYVYKFFSEIKKIKILELEEIIRKNFNKIFSVNIIEKEV
jgi:Tat protein secretion system quality control protein TatD with DNase activity